MRKVLVFIVIVACLVFFGTTSVKAVTMSVLVEQLKMKLAEDQIDFPDSILENLIKLSYGLVIPHGLAYKVLVSKYALSGQSRVFVHAEALFVSSVRIRSGISIRSLTEINLKDLARRHIETSASSPQFFVFYNDIVGGARYSYIYLYPTPTALETLQIVYYRGTAESESPPLNLAYEDLIVDFALFFAYIRKKQWRDAASTYNEAIKQLTSLRELFINRKPDITIAPKEIE